MFPGSYLRHGYVKFIYIIWCRLVSAGAGDCVAQKLRSCILSVEVMYVQRQGRRG
jgi:hypothetical protein